MPRNPATLLDLISVEVADLIADAAHKPSKVFALSEEEVRSQNDILYPEMTLVLGNLSEDLIDELLERAQVLDADLASWPDILPLHWWPVRALARTIPQEVIDAGIWEDACDIYPDVIICSTWNDWRVARLRVLRLIAELCLASQVERGETRAQTIAIIRQLVDDICASVPFCLGSRTEAVPLYQAEVIYPGIKGRLNSREHAITARAYGGWYLFSPFKETMQLEPYVRKAQREWLQAQLWRLAKLYDVKPT